MTVDDPVDGWSVISEDPAVQRIGVSAKSQPLALPPSLLGPRSPRISNPFQVPAKPSPPSRSSASQPLLSVAVSPGLSRPPQVSQHVSSLSPQFHRIQNVNVNVSHGLPAPVMQRSVPVSHIAPCSVSEISQEDANHGLAPPVTGSAKSSTPVSKPLQTAGHQEPILTRVRLAASSVVVLQLWIQFEQIFAPYSSTIQQMQSSLNHAEHRNRFLNQFAATTLVKYMPAALQFFQLCCELH